MIRNVYMPALAAALFSVACTAAAQRDASSRFPPLPVAPSGGPPPGAGRPQPGAGQGPAGGQLKIERDLAYTPAGGRALHLDLYRRAAPDGRAQPVILWLHGDGGLIADKSPTPAARLVAAGYAVASVEYRAGEAGLTDAKAAMRWLRANAAQYALDPDHIGAWGAATGGTLAALLGTTGGTDTSRVQAVVDFSGASDAVRAIGADTPPFLIVHGTADRIVPGRQSELLQLALMKADVPNTLEYVVGAGHDMREVETPEIAEETTAFFDRVLRNNRHQRDNAAMIREPEDSWISTFIGDYAGTRTMLYATPSRGPGTQGSYRLYLPPGYDANPHRRYPVIYFLHGFTDDSREALDSGYVARIDAAIRTGVMPAAIVVAVQSPNASSFLDSPGVPAESAFIKDLIPTIDRTFRTIATRAGRAIDGHSMGGTGALRLGFKYPELFGTVSAISPAMVAGREAEIVIDDPETPWGMVARNADRIRGRTFIRLIEGSADVPPRGGLLRDEWMSQVLDRYRLAHEFTLSPGATHPVRDELSRLPSNPFAFYGKAFAGLK